MTNRVRVYRTSVADGATHIDLLIATYDGMAEDLRIAGDSAENGEIGARCKHSQHALLLLGHLESWVGLLEDPVLQDSLIQFYAYIRRELIRLQVSSEQAGFAKLAMHICETRAAWQQRQSRGARVPGTAAEILGREPQTGGAESRFGWSA